MNVFNRSTSSLKIASFGLLLNRAIAIVSNFTDEKGAEPCMNFSCFLRSVAELDIGVAFVSKEILVRICKIMFGLRNSDQCLPVTPHLCLLDNSLAL